MKQPKKILLDTTHRKKERVKLSQFIAARLNPNAVAGLLGNNKNRESKESFKARKRISKPTQFNLED